MLLGFFLNFLFLEQKGKLHTTFWYTRPLFVEVCAEMKKKEDSPFEFENKNCFGFQKQDVLRYLKRANYTQNNDFSENKNWNFANLDFEIQNEKHYGEYYLQLVFKPVEIDNFLLDFLQLHADTFYDNEVIIDIAEAPVFTKPQFRFSPNPEEIVSPAFIDNRLLNCILPEECNSWKSVRLIKKKSKGKFNYSENYFQHTSTDVKMLQRVQCESGSICNFTCLSSCFYCPFDLSQASGFKDGRLVEQIQQRKYTSDKDFVCTTQSLKNNRCIAGRVEHTISSKCSWKLSYLENVACTEYPTPVSSVKHQSKSSSFAHFVLENILKNKEVISIFF